MRAHPSTLTYTSGYGRRQVVAVHAVAHDDTIRKIHRVAASLNGSSSNTREGRGKQEATGVDAPMTSTAHTVCDTEVRAASAQSDTDTR